MAGAGVVGVPAGVNIGVTQRTEDAWRVFCDLARGDFHHDFNDDRAKVEEGDSDIFFAIAKKIGTTKGNVWWKTKFTELRGSKPAELYGNAINGVLPPGPGGVAFPGEFKSEKDLMKLAGIVDYAILKGKLRRGVPFRETFEIPDTGITRIYDIRASTYKNADNGFTKNLSRIFREVTGDKEDIVLLVDAVTGLSTTGFLNNALTPETNGCKFYIVENIENTSDSATKIANLKEEPSTTGTTPAKLYYLKDTVTSVSYPVWTNVDGSDQRTNIFSNLDIVLKRISDVRVDGDIVGTLGDGTGISMSIENLSSASNVKNASLAMIATAIEKGISSDALVYALIKRMGDWCQALSLLDLERPYTILEKDRTPTEMTTLGKLIARGAEVGILTTDRVVLAFGILLGLNVFFTTGTDVQKLVYFKNTEGVALDPDALSAKANELVATATGDAYDEVKAAAEAKFAEVTAAVEAIGGRLLATGDIFEYISLLRVYVSNVGKITQDAIVNAQTTYDGAAAAFNAAVEAGDAGRTAKYEAANVLFSIFTSLKIGTETNDRVLRDLTDQRYPGVDSDRNFIDMLRTKVGSNLRLSAAEAAVREIVLSMRDAVRAFPNPSGLRTLLEKADTFVFTDRRAAREVIPNVLAAFDLLQAALPAPATGGQRGGGMAETFENIRKREILLLHERTELTSTPNVYALNDRFIDAELNEYRISDQFILTDDDLPMFLGAFDGAAIADDKARYVCFKYLLLVCDMCANELRRVVNQLPKNDDLDMYSIYPDPETPDYQALLDVLSALTQVDTAITAGDAGISAQCLVLSNGTYGKWTNLPDDPINHIVQTINKLSGDLIVLIRTAVEHLYATAAAAAAEGAAPPPPVVTEDAGLLIAINEDSIDVPTNKPLRPGVYSTTIVQVVRNTLNPIRGPAKISDDQIGELTTAIDNALAVEVNESLNSDFAPNRIADVVIKSIANRLRALGLTENDIAGLYSRVRGIRMHELSMVGMFDRKPANTARKTQRLPVKRSDLQTTGPEARRAAAEARAKLSQERIKSFRRRAANGGLRERRPLYRNASGTSDGPERDEGLRERRRTRRAPRVRQHPGKSRRGGQRNDVD
jgi:hypothetical protein